MSDAALGVLGIAVACIVAWVQLHLTPLDWWESTPRYMATNTIAAGVVIVVAGVISGRLLFSVIVLALEFAGCYLSLVIIHGAIRWIARLK